MNETKLNVCHETKPVYLLQTSVVTHYDFTNMLKSEEGDVRLTSSWIKKDFDV